MKICLHTTNQITQNYIGGTERFLVKMAKELQVLGWEPFIVCSSATDESYVEGIKVIGRLPKPFRSKASKYKILNSVFLRNEVVSNWMEPYEVTSKISSYVMMQLEGIKADIYHLNSFLSASYIEDSLKNVIVTNHQNNLEIDSIWGKGFFHKYSQFVREKRTQMQNIKGLYVPSKFYADYFSEKLDMKVDPVKLGVHINDFPPIFTKNRQIKDSLVDTEDEFIILLPSRLKITQKGHDLALKACKILKDVGIRFRLIISGLGTSPDKTIAHFRKKIKDYNVEDVVTLSSYGDIMNAYKACDVVISPERFCSYGLSISESLSLGINTVLSDIPTYKEIGSGYAHAHFFENGSPQDLSEKLMTLYSKKNPNSKLEMIRFRENNDIRDCAKSYSKIYSQLLIK